MDVSGSSYFPCFVAGDVKTSSPPPALAPGGFIITAALPVTVEKQNSSKSEFCFLFFCFFYIEHIPGMYGRVIND